MKLIFTLLSLFSVLAYTDTTTYSCNYPTYSDQAGSHRVKKKFVLNFIVDNTTGKSYLLGNNGSSEVKLIESDDQVSFLGITATGNLITTAIDSKFNSVHSRNIIILGELLPSQFYGTCEVK